MSQVYLSVALGMVDGLSGFPHEKSDFRVFTWGWIHPDFSIRISIRGFTFIGKHTKTYSEHSYRERHIKSHMIYISIFLWYLRDFSGGSWSKKSTMGFFRKGGARHSIGALAGEGHQRSFHGQGPRGSQSWPVLPSGQSLPKNDGKSTHI